MERRHETFVAELNAQQRPFSLLRETLAERLQQAIEHIGAVMKGKRSDE
jgi:hypothetical protein